MSQPASHPVRVLVVDDQALMRDGIASLLGLQAGIEVVGTAEDGAAAVVQARSLQPDVILMDVRMPKLDGVAATAAIKREHPAVQVLMLTTFDDDEHITSALRAGALGYLLKDIPAEDLARAILAAHRRIYQLDPSVAQRLVSQVAPHTPPRSAPLEITERELEVARLVARGANNREISETLFISEGTVKNHISNILSRLNLRDRTQIALYARDKGWL